MPSFMMRHSSCSSLTFVSQFVVSMLPLASSFLCPRVSGGKELPVLQGGATTQIVGLGWLWSMTFHHLAHLLSQFCQFPISPSRTRQRVEHLISKQTQPSYPSGCPNLYSIPENSDWKRLDMSASAVENFSWRASKFEKLFYIMRQTQTEVNKVEQK